MSAAPSASRTSCRKRILEVLDLGNGMPMTAGEIKRKIRDYPLATVSSTLAKMTKGGMLLRKKGIGPRGGYGYVRTYDVEADVSRAMARLLDGLFEINHSYFPPDGRSGPV